MLLQLLKLLLSANYQGNKDKFDFLYPPAFPVPSCHVATKTGRRILKLN